MMPVDLEDLSVNALKDLGRLQELPGHNDMTREELLNQLDGPVDDATARWLGRTRQDLYAEAQSRGIDGLKDLRKKNIIRALANTA